LAPTTPTWPFSHSNLGNVLADLGDLTSARAEHERALEIGQATLDPDHPTIAVLRRNLDHVLQRLGDEERRDRLG
jgi:hypothetical protein